MNIAVDAREMAGRPTGVGRYLAKLLAAWAHSAAARRHHWRFFAPQSLALPNPFSGGLTILPGRGGSQWEQWTLARALGAPTPDVLFAPAYTAPLTAPCTTVVTIHDVSFAAHPEWYAWREGTRRRWLTAWSARRARLVLTDSQFSRDEIVRHIGIAGRRVRVIPLGIDPPASVSAVASDGTRTPTILYVGSIFRRRHVDKLIASFVDVVAPRVPGSRLEIVGENRCYPPYEPAAGLGATPHFASRVRLRSYVDERTLRELYQQASVFAFPSEYEGFGLTPLEALAAGVPPVVLDTPVARETLGPAARYVDSVSTVEPLGEALVELLTNQHARTTILDHAAEVLARYDWEQTAALTLRALEEAAGA